MKGSTRWMRCGCVLAAFAMASCARVVTRITSERAPWSYVEDAWGGMSIKATPDDGKRVLLDVRLNLHRATRLDSAICVRGVHATREGARILVRLDKGLCGEGSPVPLRLTLERPDPGRYEIVYDDEAAAFPVVGELEVR